MTRYRLVVFGKPRSWRSSKEEAQQQAINAKLASRDEFQQNRVYLSPGVTIERESAPN